VAGPSDIEQLLLEEINFARMNPLGDAARYISSYAPLTSSAPNIQSALKFFNVSGAALLAAYQQLIPTQPVAWNENLATGARGHNAAMIAADQQTHQAPGEADLGARATAAGYSWNALGENVYSYAYDALYAQAGFMVDWGDGPNGMQAEAGHRVNIMNPTYREVGVAVTAETNPNTEVGPLVVTEDFGRRSTSLGPIVLGVAFNDADHNRFYSLGEGRGDLTVGLTGGPSVATYASGGYTLQAAATGPATVTFSGGGLSAQLRAAVNLVAAGNVKMDVVNGNELWTSTSAQVSGPVGKIVGLGLSGLTLSYTGTGPVTFVGTAGNDSLTGSSGFDRADYSSAASAVAASLATGQATGGGGSDTLASIEGLIGSAFNDTLTGSAGSNSLDGGAGNDTSLYSGLYRAYAVSAAGGNETVAGGPEGGTDSLTSIEKTQFVDGYFNTGTADPAAQVYRIYQAALGRAPDQAGLTNWVQAIGRGVGLQTIGDGFLGSPEFVARFGAGDNTQFVTLLYNNVLHRAPDAPGQQAWVNYINAGHSRSEVLTGFSESPEFANGTAPQVQQGLWVGDANAAKVARLYDAVFDRLPDAVGEANWTTALQGGLSLQAAADGFVGSNEFQARYGALNNSQFVQQLYLNVLGRPADQGGLDNWSNFIAAGHSRAEVVIGLSESAEHVALTAPYIDNGVWFI
jgi:uncharacterized protein YkwD